MPGQTVRRCFELSGVVPLAVFVVVHLVVYARVLVGARDFGVPPAQTPGGWLLEVALLWAPLAFHVVVGAWLSFSKLEGAADERGRSIVLRVTGILAFAFVVAHGVWMRAPLARGVRAPEDIEPMLVARLSATIHGIPWAAALHLLGIGAVLIHLGVGVARFVSRWGIADAVVARRVAGIGCAVLFAAAAAAVVELATGSAIPRFLSAWP